MRRIFYLSMFILFLSSGIFISCAPQQAQTTVQSETKQPEPQIDSAQVKMYLSFGWENYKNKQYSRAIEQFKKVLELDPQNEKAHKLLADCYLHHPDPTYIDSAFALYQNAIKKFPDNAYFYTGLGYIYQRQWASLTKDALDEPDSSKSAVLKQKATDMEDRALENFLKAVELNEKDVVSYNSIGKIMLHRGKLDTAMDWFEKATAIDSNNTTAWEYLAKLYEARNINDKAAVAYGHLHRLNPKNPDYLLKNGQYLAKTGKFDEATKILEKYITSNPDDYRGYQYMGLALAADGKHREALEQFKKAEKINPNSVKLMCDIAVNYKDMKKYSSAEKYVSKAKSIDSNYGYIYIVEGEIIQDKAMDKVPASGELNMDVKCQFLKATKIYKKALRDENWSALARSKLEYLKPYIPTKEEIAAYKFIEGKSCGE
ncbi:tetratricopeptide repeat protein [bacterium]|nr:tetratricopeptide repeat protein [bacterium]